MLKTRDFVPSIYYNTSRDFQYIAHLFDLVFNALKTEADLVFNLPLSDNSNDQLLDLLAYTFGLKIDMSRCNSKQLRAICHAAPTMMKNKGSRRAIEALCKALLSADGIEDGFSIEIDHDTNTLTIRISQYATCFGLLAEVLPYILPAGLDFNILITAEKNISGLSTKIGLQDTVIATEHCNTDPKIITGYAYDSGKGIFIENDTTDNKTALALQPGYLANYSFSTEQRSITEEERRNTDE